MAQIKFRDPVHNFTRFNGEEAKLIDLGLLQRLRGIRQLAMASLVYPGALHTRFDHTLGVTHVAGQMAEELDLDTDERRLVRLACLLHDVGHGPFSHVSESALERFADREVLSPDQKKEKIHELITQHLICNHPPLHRKLAVDTCDAVARLLSSGEGDPVLRSVVSGPLDADKQDYLLRDSQFAGVNYGIFDIHQLQRSLLAQRRDGLRHLMIRRDGVHAVEQFVLAKYYLTTMVYRHKVRLVTDQMILRAITLGIERDNNEELTRLYRFDGTSGFYENYLGWNDARFLQKFGEESPAGSRCGHLLGRLLSRNLLKRVFYAREKDFSPECRDNLMAVGKREHDGLRGEVEGEIAGVLAREFGVEVSADYTILHAYQIKSVREASRNDEAPILVFMGPELPHTFEEESTLFSSINERLAEGYVEVYAPVTWGNPAERTGRLNAVGPRIREIIENRLTTMQLPLNL